MTKAEILDQLELWIDSVQEEVDTRRRENPEDETASVLHLFATGIALIWTKAEADLGAK